MNKRKQILTQVRFDILGYGQIQANTLRRILECKTLSYDSAMEYARLVRKQIRDRNNHNAPTND